MAATIRPMFIALPLPRGIDADDLLRGYLFALDGEPEAAVRNVVGKLCKGTWSGEIKFCPRPPELAGMVREERRTIELLSEPRRLPPPAVNVPFKDWRVIHRERTKELAEQGFRMIANEISQVAWHLGGQRRQWPVGSIWFWSIQEAWGPAQ